MRPLVWRTFVTVAILAVLISVLPVSDLWAGIGRIAPWVWVIAVTGFLAGHVVAAWKWRLLVEACGLRYAQFEAIQAQAAGLFANLCLPSLVGGDVVRAGLIVRRHGRLETVALGSLIDRLIDTFALAVLAAAGGLALAEEFDRTGVLALLCAAVSLPLGVAGVGAVVLLLPPERFPVKLGGVVNRMAGALRSLAARPGVALAALLLSLLVQSAFVLLNIVIATVMGIEVGAWVWFLAWPMAKIIALVPVSLGGIGVREVALAGLLVPFGVDAVDAVAQSLSWEVVLVGSGLVAGVFAALAQRYRAPNEVLS